MNREELMAAMAATAAPKLIEVTVEGWGLLYVKPPTVEEVDDATDEDKKQETQHRRLARGAARIICDAKGTRVFDPKNPADLTLLAQQPWALLQKVLAATDVKVDSSGN